jgi:hypothetical protein
MVDRKFQGARGARDLPALGGGVHKEYILE